jgi:methylmalonyl-CoA mutase N-terminal domain/subunit
VETLTNELEAKANEYLNKIEDMGGAVAAIESGYMQREIQEAAWRYQQEIDQGQRIIVGVNKFQLDGEEPKPIFRVNPEVERAQVRRLQAVKAERDNAAVSASLGRLGDAARGDENLLPPIVEAVKAYATMGEMCGVLRHVFGDFQPPSVI